MDLFEFEIILDDTYEVDAWLPTLCAKNSRRFKEVSYSKAAVSNLKQYIKNEFGSRKKSVDDYMYAITKYIKQMEKFAKVNADNSFIFTTAASVASNVNEILRGMR